MISQDKRGTPYEPIRSIAEEFSLAVQTGTSDEALDRRASARQKTQSYLPHLLAAAAPEQARKLEKVDQCAEVITEYAGREEGTTYLTSSYCRSRLCLVCNRIRTGQYIEKYQHLIDDFEAPHFVTLTLPNVKAPVLRETVRTMLRTFRLVQDNLRKSRSGSRLLSGIRKVECTYNAPADSYHPHLHLVVADELQAYNLLAGWLQRVPTAVRAAQDMRPLHDGDSRELFKYFTKLVAGSTEMQPHAVLHMADALAGVRLVDPFGATRGAVQIQTETDGPSFRELVRLDSEQYYSWDSELKHWSHVMLRQHIHSRVVIRQLFDRTGRPFARPQTNVCDTAKQGSLLP